MNELMRVKGSKMEGYETPNADRGRSGMIEQMFPSWRGGVIFRRRQRHRREIIQFFQKNSEKSAVRFFNTMQQLVLSPMATSETPICHE